MVLQRQKNSVTAVLGVPWGDEGKGKVTDYIAGEYDLVSRINGGANAGHTVYFLDPLNPGNIIKVVFHQIPSGVLYPHVTGVIGNGSVMHLPTLCEEMAALENIGISIHGRLFISDHAHILFDFHKKIDLIQESRRTKKIGTTGRGIGPCYMDKAGRFGIRMSDFRDWDRFVQSYLELLAIHKMAYSELSSFDFALELEELKKIHEYIVPLIADTVFLLNNAFAEGKRILIEGANGGALDIDHGTYPFVTSSNTTIGGHITGSGLPPQAFQRIIGVVKAYTTRVGEGPFPTELLDETGEKLRKIGQEFGATTNRPRDCGWFDAVITRHFLEINGVTEINLTKLDVLNSFPKIKVCTGYALGKMTTTRFCYPFTELSVMARAEPQYVELDGWLSDISGITDFRKLPRNCRRYIHFLEELCGRKATFIGVGPRRDQMIVR